MNKKLKIFMNIITLYITATFAVYLIGVLLVGFISWGEFHWNMMYWSIDSRAAFGMFNLIIMIFSVGIPVTTAL